MAKITKQLPGTILVLESGRNLATQFAKVIGYSNENKGRMTVKILESKREFVGVYLYEDSEYYDNFLISFLAIGVLNGIPYFDRPSVEELREFNLRYPQYDVADMISSMDCIYTVKPSSKVLKETSYRRVVKKKIEYFVCYLKNKFHYKPLISYYDHTKRYFIISSDSENIYTDNEIIEMQKFIFIF